MPYPVVLLLAGSAAIAAAGAGLAAAAVHGRASPARASFDADGGVNIPAGYRR